MSIFRKKVKNIKRKLYKKKPGKDSNSSKIKNIIIGALLGYFTGVIITFILFYFLLSDLKYSYYKTTWICCIAGVFLTLGLALNRNIRCQTILIFPSLCSKKGRSLLIGYAFFLSATGPCKNILHNIEVISKSLSCGEDILKTTLKNMLDMVKAPLIAIKNAMRIFLNEMEKLLNKIENAFKEMGNLIKKVCKTIKTSLNFLGKFFKMCNAEFGTPFNRCLQEAELGMENCRKIMGRMCLFRKIFNLICYSLKIVDAFCLIFDFISDKIIGKISSSFQKGYAHLKETFYVSVKFKHDFYITTKVSKNYSAIGEDILRDIEEFNSNSIFLVLSWTKVFACLLFLQLYIKAIYYKYKYLQNDYYDNYFIGQDFILINEQRRAMGKELALPLTRKERWKYVKITSKSLVRSELLKVATSIIFILNSTIQLIAMCFVDYSFYWVLNVIRYYGRKQAGLEVQPFKSIKVRGIGILAEILKSMVKAFRPLREQYDIDFTPCLPNPRKPDYQRFIEIGVVLFLCWTFLFIEPYILRLRQVIMRTFYPERARERAVWLYNNILMKRTGFLKLARRQARSKILNDDSKDVYSCMDWLRAKTNSFWIFRKLFGTGALKHCMLCGSPFTKNSNSVNCASTGCKGVYCEQCYAELSNICFLCNKPIDYGDMSDVSEEKYSSDELEDIFVIKYCR